jgi:hypothetical protein
LTTLRANYAEQKGLPSSASKNSSEQSSTQSSPIHDVLSPTRRSFDMEAEEADTSFVLPKIDSYKNTERKLRAMSDLSITQDIKDEELISMFKEAELIEEQADILHYLSCHKLVFH